jgi:HSP20 family protein
MSNELVPFDSISSLIDRIFHEDDWVGRWSTFYRQQDFPLTSQLPVDIVLKENRDAEISAALAGYPEDSVSIDFDGDYMKISVDKKEEKEDNGDRYICRGIKKSNARVKLFIPSARYDHAKAKANLKDGILTILIPAKDEAKPHRLEITRG